MAHSFLNISNRFVASFVSRILDRSQKSENHLNMCNQAKGVEITGSQTKTIKADETPANIWSLFVKLPADFGTYTKNSGVKNMITA